MQLKQTQSHSSNSVQRAAGTRQIACVASWEFWLAAERSNQAEWMMNCFRTCWNDYGPRPTMSTSHQPDNTDVMNNTRPSPFFAALLHPCIIVNRNRKRGRPGNKATLRHHRCYELQMGLAVWSSFVGILMMVPHGAEATLPLYIYTVLQSVSSLPEFNKHCLYSSRSNHVMK